MLYDFFYFFKLFKIAPGGWMPIKSNDIWKSEMLAGKPDQLFISPSSPMNMPPNKKYTVYVNL